MPKVFYDGCIFYRQRHGGINVVFSEIFKLITKLSDFDCVCTFPSYNKCDDITAIKKYIIPKIRPHRLYRYFWLILNEFYLIKYKPDIYHSTYFSAPLRYRKCKTVITVHDMIYEIFPAVYNRKLDRDFVRQKHRLVLGADAIICVSESTKQDLLRFYPEIKESKVSVIHNAVDEFFLSPTTEEEKKDFMNKNRLFRPYLLYVGTIERKYKNFDLLLDAYCSCPQIYHNFDLVLVTSDLFDESQAQKVSQFPTFIRKFSQVNNHELKMFYSCAKVFVYPSKYEGFGIPLLEAMACKTPIVASNISSSFEVGGDGLLYFNPNSQEDLRVKMLYLMNDEKLRINIIANADKNLRRFSWETSVHKIIEVYRQLETK